jgi:hypothetical protein
MAVQFFGLEFTTDHAKLAGSILGGILAVGGFIAGRWSSYLQRSRIEKEDLVATSIVVEMVAHPASRDGLPETLTASRTTSLSDFFQNDALVAAIRKAALRHPGLLRLHDPMAHRLMMVEAGNWLQGLNAQANLDFIAGKPTELYEVLIGFAAYPAGAAGAGQFHDEVDRLFLMVVNRASAEALLKQQRQQLPAPSSHLPRRIVDLIAEWDRVRQGELQSSSSECVWPLHLRVSAPSMAGKLPLSPP